MKRIILFVITLLLTGCTFGRKVEYIGNKIEINNNECKIEEEKDTHGGFLGDGDYFARVVCSKLDSSQLSSNWKELPLSSSLDRVKNLIQCNSKQCATFFERYHIPEIKNGYYYFYDRHSESIDKYDDTDLNNRSSYNFSLAIYDSDSGVIYYYKLDT